MDTRFFTVLILATVLVSQCHGEGSSHMVIVPKIIRPGHPLDISVQVNDNGQPSSAVFQVQAKLYYKTDRGESEEVIVGQLEQPETIDRQGIVSIMVPSSVSRSSYMVSVMASGSQNFHVNTSVTTQFKSNSIFIQTDKAMYKPGSLVRWRALAVYPSLLPYQGNLNVVLMDPNESRIKQWLEVSDESGVVSGDLQLSDQPVMGTWKIEVTTQTKEKKTLNFEVAEYVLPKYEVKLHLPSYIYAETATVKVGVEAKYTYGKPVKGLAVLSVKIKTSGWYEERYNYTTIKRTLELSMGKAETSFTREELISLAGNLECYNAMCYSDDAAVAVYAQMNNIMQGKTISFVADVTETLTGNNFSTNGTVMVASNPYTVAFLSFSPSTFKPGLSWAGVVKVSKLEGNPPTSKDLMDYNGDEVQLEATCSCTLNNYQNKKEEKLIPVTPSGLIQLTFLPHVNATRCSLSAKFKYAQASKSIQKFESKEQKGIQITIPGLDGPVKPDTTVTFKVVSTENIKGFFYQMLSKGGIYFQSYIRSINPDAAEFEFDIEMTRDKCRELAPTGRMLVWYITAKGELIADSLDFNVDGAFSNEVSLEFSTNETKPGNDVSLTVHASPMSHVGMLAVDQSVLLLAGSNDITQDKVLAELKEYDSSTSGGSPGYIDFGWWWPRYRGGQDTSEILENAGVNVLTDSLIYKKSSCYDCYDVRGPVGRTGGTGAVAGPELEQMEPIEDGDDGAKDDGDDSDLQEPERVRSEFPETWLWVDEVAGPDGRVSITSQVPDTITSWVASAFAVSQEDGLGIAPTRAKLQVVKPFFVSMNLPYSLKRGEEVALQVTVFNYLPTDLRVSVMLLGSTQFQVRQAGMDEPVSDVDVRRGVRVRSGDAELVSFWIVPTELGHIELSVEARSQAAADAVTRTILVEPEGEPKEHSRSILINLQNEGMHSEIMTVEYPETGVVEGSQRVRFTAVGNIMGPSISGLDKLLKMPYGCGEQNMVNFAPNIYILQYLTAANMLTAEIKTKALTYMSSGYQRELTYRRKDGSFSAFGDRDTSGSTWLTAFVIRCFNQAKQFMDIDQKVIDTAVLFITKNQENGAFMEPGRVLHSGLQGGSSSGLAMTAYVTATLHENKDDIEDSETKMKAERAIQSAFVYMEGKLEEIKDDPYVLSLVTYALTLAGRSKAEVAMNYFNQLKVEEGGLHWEKEEEKPVPEPYYWRWRSASSYNVEMTAYGLLICTLNKDLVDGSKIISWLAMQRNSYGGYRSTQDTVIALQAMSTFESAVGDRSDQQSIDVKLQVDGTDYMFDTITSDNSILLQSIELASEVNDITLTAEGSGIALVQMNIYYHQLEGESQEGIQVTAHSQTTETQEVVTEVCAQWTLTNGQVSGMVVIEMGLLTAYEPLTGDLMSRYGELGLKRFEVSETTLTLYLDELTQEEICISVTSVNVSPVSNLQEAVVVVYQYYEPDIRNSAKYLPDSLISEQQNVCDMCAECCDIIEETCEDSPCQHGGTCTEVNGIYTCQCMRGYKGQWCESMDIRKSPLTSAATVPVCSAFLSVMVLILVALIG